LPSPRGVMAGEPDEPLIESRWRCHRAL
jgi:hypothetical protein